MGKKTAHIVLIFGDFLTLFILWIGYNEINGVVTGIAKFSDSVSFNSKVGGFFVIIFMPIIHIYVICEYFFLQKVLPKIAKWVNRSIIILCIVLFASAIFISFYMRVYVIRAGYVHCYELDDQLSFSTYLMYTKNNDVCSRLIEEKNEEKAGHQK